MVFSLLILVLGSSAYAQEPCPDPDANLTWARDAVLQFGFAEADGYLLDAEEGFGCSAVATRRQAARVHLIRAARHDFDGNAADRDRHLASARAADPDYYEDKFGEDLKALWAGSTPEGAGTVAIPALPQGWSIWIDGVPSAQTDPLSTGPHLLQIGASQDKVAWAKGIEVRAGEVTTVGVPASLVPVVAEEALVTTPTAVGTTESHTTLTKKKPKTGLLVTGILMTGVGTGAAVGTYFAARNVDKSDPSGTALLVGNTAGWGVAGVGLGVAVLGLTPRKSASVAFGDPAARKNGVFVGVGGRGMSLNGRW